MPWVFILLLVIARNAGFTINYKITAFVLKGWSVKINPTPLRELFNIIAVSLISSDAATLFFCPLVQDSGTQFLARIFIQLPFNYCALSRHGEAYAHKVIEHGWSRAVLTHHIETQLHKREGKRA
jgi:hypothetical protein